jgi:hypothetical protein
MSTKWPTPEEEERAIQVELMKTQIDYYRAQMRLDVIKVLIAFLAASAAFGGVAVGLAALLAPHFH